MAGRENPFPRVAEFWEDVIADMEATAAEYRDRGWETVELHPGDVTPVTPTDDSERYGLDVVVPGNEFDEVEALVERGASFDAYEVYRGSGGGIIFLVVTMEDPSEKLAVLFPAYYDPSAASEMLRLAEENDRLYTYVRPLRHDREVAFTHAAPEGFFPED